MAKKPKTLQIFRTGKHTAMAGQVLEFSETDLEAAAQAYNPAIHEAPIVIGHPKDNGPAWGWVSSLSFADGALEAEPSQVDPAFQELVEAGRFKKISASFYSPDSPANPVPGSYYLRHVGFLGAQPPALKGLRDVSFAENEPGVVEFGELDSWDIRTLAGALRGLREWIAGKFDLEEANKALPAYCVESLEDAARRPNPPTETATAASFHEPNPTQEDQMALASGGNASATKTPTAEELTEKAAALAAQEQELASQAQALKEKEAALAQQEETKTRAAHADYAETLCKAGKLAPGSKAAVVELLALASKAAPLEFGEGDRKQTVPLADSLRQLLEAAPKLVHFGEMSGTSTATTLPNLDDPQAMASAAVEFQESERQKGRVVSISAAVEAIRKGSR